MAEWFENETFWEELYLFLFPESRFAEALDQVDSVLAISKPPGRDVLDLCCGPGRFSIAMARNGYNVTGVDRSRYLLTRAREHSRKTGLAIEWVEEDMRSFVRPASFDLILSMFTSFGYFEDRNGDLLVFKNMFTNCRPGGVCILELKGKEQLAAIFQPTSATTLADGSVLVERREIVDDWTRIKNEWILIRKDKAITFRFTLCLYSGQELRDMLNSVGFSDISLYGNFEGAPYGPETGRLVAVARKSG